LVILITLGEEYKLWSSSLWSFLQPRATSSLVVKHLVQYFCQQMALKWYLSVVWAAVLSHLVPTVLFFFEWY
jgi:hypothetical protein